MVLVLHLLNNVSLSIVSSGQKKLADIITLPTSFIVVKLLNFMFTRMGLMNHKYNNIKRKAIAGITLATVLFTAATFLALSLLQHNPLAAAQTNNKTSAGNKTAIGSAQQLTNMTSNNTTTNPKNPNNTLPKGLEKEQTTTG
jgi:hypothetical protein